MKKLILFITAIFAFLSVEAQITQFQSDSIVLQRMSEEIRQHTIHAKNHVQTEYTITTSQNEILELDYSCWVYFVNFIEQGNRTFVFVAKDERNQRRRKN